MTIAPGTYLLGPDDATLSVRTGKTGAASKAGHNLHMRVGSWQGTLQLGDDPADASVQLTADARSLTVLEGTGGMQALGEEEKAGIKQTIDDEVLKGCGIAFQSHRAHHDGNGGPLRVEGELELLGASRPLTFELHAGDDGHLTATATVRQTAWGIKPYSALFGTLKVADEVVVELDGQLPAG